MRFYVANGDKVRKKLQKMFPQRGILFTVETGRPKTLPLPREIGTVPKKSHACHAKSGPCPKRAAPATQNDMGVAKTGMPATQALRLRIRRPEMKNPTPETDEPDGKK